MDGFCISGKILHSWRDRVKQHAEFGRSLAIFTKHTAPDGDCLVNCAKLKAQPHLAVDRQSTLMQDFHHTEETKQ
jgi:hypothetical protein